MISEKIKPIIIGSINHIPGIKMLKPKSTGGTINSKYCYSVWLRHLKHLFVENNNKIPEIIAELGPGDSLGIGLAGLLTGCKKLYALDVVKYWDNKRNIKVFDELVELYKNKTEIPDKSEFPLVFPLIDNYDFPKDILTEDRLRDSLQESRLNQIRHELANIDNCNHDFIQYKIPWFEKEIIERESIDFIYSQAVLEHIENLELTYLAMSNWLKPMGYMSHTIDFKSHGMTKSWNGHWTLNDFEWKIVKGGRKYLLNRKPISYHIGQHKKFKFKILQQIEQKLENSLKKNQLSKSFKDMTDSDLSTSGVYFLSQKII